MNGSGIWQMALGDTGQVDRPCNAVLVRAGHSLSLQDVIQVSA